MPSAKSKTKLVLSEVALFGVLGALTFGLKVAMAFLPNIEPTSLMVMLFAVTFRRKAVYPIYVYVLLEFLVYGFNLWSINYLYIWLILAVAAWLCRGLTHPLAWAIVSGAFGLCFGLLCAPVYLFVGGFHYAVAWWVSGLFYDVLHCAGNFVIALVLFKPLRTLLGKLYGEMQRRTGAA